MKRVFILSIFISKFNNHSSGTMLITTNYNQPSCSYDKNLLTSFIFKQKLVFLEAGSNSHLFVSIITIKWPYVDHARLFFGPSSYNCSLTHSADINLFLGLHCVD